MSFVVENSHDYPTDSFLESLLQQPAAAPAIIPPLSVQIGEKSLGHPRKKLPSSSDGEAMVFPTMSSTKKPWKKASERSAPATGPKAVKKRQPRAKKEKAGMVSPNLVGMAVKPTSLINDSALLDELLAAAGAAKKQALEVPSQSTTQTPVASNAHVQGATCEQYNEHHQGQANEQIVKCAISADVDVSAVGQPEPPPPAVSPSGESFLAQQNSANDCVPSTIDCSAPSAVQDSDVTTAFDTCNDITKTDNSVGYSNDTGGTYADSSLVMAKTATTGTTSAGNDLTSAYLNYYLQQAQYTGNNLLNNTSNLTNSFGNNSLSGGNSNIYASMSNAYSGTTNVAGSYTNNALGLAGYGVAMGTGTGSYNTSAYASTPSYNTSTYGLNADRLNGNVGTFNTNAAYGACADSSYGVQQQSLLGSNVSGGGSYNALLQLAGLSGYASLGTGTGNCYSNQLQSGYNTSGYGGCNTSSYGAAATGTSGEGCSTSTYGTAATGTSGYGGCSTSTYGTAATGTSGYGAGGNTSSYGTVATGTSSYGGNNTSSHGSAATYTSSSYEAGGNSSPHSVGNGGCDVSSLSTAPAAVAGNAGTYRSSASASSGSGDIDGNLATYYNLYLAYLNGSLGQRQQY